MSVSNIASSKSPEMPKLQLATGRAIAQGNSAGFNSGATVINSSVGLGGRVAQPDGNNKNANQSLVFNFNGAAMLFALTAGRNPVISSGMLAAMIRDKLHGAEILAKAPEVDRATTSAISAAMKSKDLVEAAAILAAVAKKNPIAVQKVFGAKSDSNPGSVGKILAAMVKKGPAAAAAISIAVGSNVLKKCIFSIENNTSGALKES